MVIEPSNEARERLAGKIQLKRRSLLAKRFSVAASILLFLFAGIYSIGILNSDKVDLSRGEVSEASYGGDQIYTIIKE